MARDEFGAKLVAQLKARADEKESLRRKPTSVCLPWPIYFTLESAAKKQGTTMTAIVLFSLEGILSELLERKPSTTASDATSVNQRFALEVVSRLKQHEYMGAGGYGSFSIRMPAKTHRMLELAATRHRTKRSRIIAIVLEAVAPYLLTHSWGQHELFDQE